METAGMETAGMETAGMETAGMETAGMETAGMETAGMETAGMPSLLHILIRLGDGRHAVSTTYHNYIPIISPFIHFNIML